MRINVLCKINAAISPSLRYRVKYDIQLLINKGEIQEQRSFYYEGKTNEKIKPKLVNGF